MNVSELKQQAKLQLEAMAEAERLKYVTPGAGKAMAYQQQRDELEAWLKGERRPHAFPIATATAIALKVELQIVMNEWFNNIARWQIIGAKIEANLARYKQELAALSYESSEQYDAWLSAVNFMREL